MHGTAKARNVKQSARKIRLVVDQIRGKDINEAYGILRFSQKKASEVVEKTLKSAVANALYRADEQGDRLDVDTLYVKLAYVDEGQTMRRWRARAMGRAAPIRRRTSHVTVIVDRKE